MRVGQPRRRRLPRSATAPSRSRPFARCAAALVVVSDSFLSPLGAQRPPSDRSGKTTGTATLNVGGLNAPFRLEEVPEELDLFGKPPLNHSHALGIVMAPEVNPAHIAPHEASLRKTNSLT